MDSIANRTKEQVEQVLQVQTRKKEVDLKRQVRIFFLYKKNN